MVKLVKFTSQFSFSDALFKAVLGYGHERISDKKTLDNMQRHYAGEEGQLETVVHILLGNSKNEEMISGLIQGFQVINMLLQELSSEEYRTKATFEVGQWSFIANIIIPQCTCLYSEFIDRVNKSSPLAHFYAYLPSMASGLTPSKILKKYLVEKTHNRLDLKEEVNAIKTNSALTHKSIKKLLKSIKEQCELTGRSVESVFQLTSEELEAFVNCSRYLQCIHNALSKEFSNSQVTELYQHMIQCYDYAKIVSCEESYKDRNSVGIILYPRMFMNFHKKLFTHLYFNQDNQLVSSSFSNIGLYKAIRDSLRSNLYNNPNNFLPVDLINPFGCVIEEIFNSWNNRKWNRTEFPYTKSGVLLKNLSRNINFELIKSSLPELLNDEDYIYHKHETLYYQSLHLLMTREYEKSLETALKSLELCQSITAGKITIQCVELIIMLKLLQNKPLHGGWYKKYMKPLMFSVQNETYFIISNNGEVNHKTDNMYIEYYVLYSIVNKFNQRNICDSNGCVIKYDPLENFKVLIEDIYNQLDEYNSESSVYHAVKNSVKGFDLSRYISQPIPFTFEMGVREIMCILAIFNVKYENASDGMKWLLNRKADELDFIAATLSNLRTEKQRIEHEKNSKFDLFRLAQLVRIDNLGL